MFRKMLNYFRNFVFMDKFAINKIVIVKFEPFWDEDEKKIEKFDRWVNEIIIHK